MRRLLARCKPRWSTCLAAVLLAVVGSPDSVAAGKTHTVVIEGMAFHPQTLEAQAGDTVVWINRDIVPHTVTAASPKFDSGEIAAGRSWSRRFTSAGKVSYYCAYHPVMKADVAVGR
ncbi:Plastocyanin [Noviherbaspirillum humi]|uniref:Plastocyanin n=1 Tax=Noviherbaspirillum humi TaxID=1688639 RepID=A0A239IPW4_9BURK|nr:cupredoxin family copper-binding protein [Noviherbaspirillum humi]SNS95601.1 Plastocyanin [Noviherbaspirillum humi]